MTILDQDAYRAYKAFLESQTESELGRLIYDRMWVPEEATLSVGRFQFTDGRESFRADFFTPMGYRFTDAATQRGALIEALLSIWVDKFDLADNELWHGVFLHKINASSHALVFYDACTPSLENLEKVLERFADWDRTVYRGADSVIISFSRKETNGPETR